MRRNLTGDDASVQDGKATEKVSAPGHQGQSAGWKYIESHQKVIINSYKFI